MSSAAQPARSSRARVARNPKQAAALFKQLHGEEHIYYSTCLNNLGMLYARWGENAKAEAVLREVVELRRRSLGEDDVRFLDSLQDLAEFYQAIGDAAKAAAVEQRLRDRRTQP